MTNYVQNNSADEDLDRIVLWQYDNSTHICNLIDQFKKWFNEVCEIPWDEIAKAMSLDEDALLDEFGLALWGRLTRTPRLQVVVGDETRPTSLDLYRKIIAARLRLLASNASIEAYERYISFVFGDDVTVVDGHDMSLSFVWSGPEEDLTEEQEEERYILEHNADQIFDFPAGVHDNDQSDSLRFWLAENASDVPSSDVHGGGLDESSFNWRT